MSLLRKTRCRFSGSTTAITSRCSAHGGVGVLLVALGASIALAQSNQFVQFDDAPDDWLARPMAPGDSPSFDMNLHRPPDLLTIRIGPWRPRARNNDLFDGRFLPPGGFVRLDLEFDGLINPPGSTRPDAYEPFAYGPNPVYGFVELDMDENTDTGGELDAPSYRYVGNAVRFGGKPAVEWLEDRFACDHSAFDGDFESPPFVDRSGEEFHLALLGDQFTPTDVLILTGDNDLLFEAGERWQIEGPWFHRAHGYEPFSLAFGGQHPGAYEPLSTLQFAHDLESDTTRVSLVFPLSNEAWAEFRDLRPEAANSDPTDQFSVHEALDDLRWSAAFLDSFPTGLPSEAIITGWLGQTPDDFLRPQDWRVTALLGSAYTAAPPAGEYFVWTDIYPDPQRGDVNGDNEASDADRHAIEDYIRAHDASDGILDGAVAVSGFPLHFSVFDVDHSGAVAPLDIARVGQVATLDDDGDVDLADFAVIQACAAPIAGDRSDACGLADIDMDGDVDAIDFQRLLGEYAGPAEGS